MRDGAAFRTTMPSSPVPLPLRILARLVLEVLPATMASLIGGFLLAHYQFGTPAAPRPTADAAGPAPAQMIELLREEHAMIRHMVAMQIAVQKPQPGEVDAERAPAKTVRMPAPRRMATVAAIAADPVSPVPPMPLHSRTPAMPARSLAVAPPPAAGPEQVAAAQGAPSAPADNAGDSLVEATLAIPGRMVAATLHAVTAIGGIPIWIGRRLGGAATGGAEHLFSAAS